MQKNVSTQSYISYSFKQKKGRNKMKIMSYKELFKESIESKRRYFIEIVDNYPGVSINAIATVMGSNKITVEKLINKIGLHKLFTSKSRNMSIRFKQDFTTEHPKSNRLEPHTIVVHSGCFHADDVFQCGPC